jgi:hypothetical protein
MILSAPFVILMLTMFLATNILICRYGSEMPVIEAATIGDASLTALRELADWYRELRDKYVLYSRLNCNDNSDKLQALAHVVTCYNRFNSITSETVDNSTMHEFAVTARSKTATIYGWLMRLHYDIMEHDWNHRTSDEDFAHMICGIGRLPQYQLHRNRYIQIALSDIAYCLDLLNTNYGKMDKLLTELMLEEIIVMCQRVVKYLGIIYYFSLCALLKFHIGMISSSVYVTMRKPQGTLEYLNVVFLQQLLQKVRKTIYPTKSIIIKPTNTIIASRIMRRISNASRLPHDRYVLFMRDIRLHCAKFNIQLQ